MKSEINRRQSTTKLGSLSSRRKVVTCSDMAISSSATPTVFQVSDDRLEIPDDPRRVFGEIIAGNNHVCQVCYRRHRRHEQFPWEVGVDRHEILAFVDEELPPGAEWDYLDRQYFESIKLPDRLERVYTEDGKGTYCSGCGNMETHRSPSTRPVSRARDAAIQLSVTLHEYGIDHDWIRLVERVQELKREPETAGNDFECFRMAVADAIQSANVSYSDDVELVFNEDTDDDGGESSSPYYWSWHDN